MERMVVGIKINNRSNAHFKIALKVEVLLLQTSRIVIPEVAILFLLHEKRRDRHRHTHTHTQMLESESFILIPEE
jgi:hypothetical protein